jgi:hypothetical protein
MKSFDFVFGNMLGEMLLNHADNLSKTLQRKTISAAADCSNDNWHPEFHSPKCLTNFERRRVIEHMN